MFDIAAMSLEQVELQTIDLTDSFFQISLPKDLTLLCQSIEKIGVMHPPVLQKHSVTTASYRVISGFQRVFACQEIGLSKIPVHVMGSDVSLLDCAKWAIADNRSQRTLSPLEQSKALALIENTMPPNLSIGDIAQSLGLPSTKKAMDKIRPLCHMPDFIQQGIVHEYIALPIAHSIAQLPETDARSYTQLFKQLKAGVNVQREILSTCDEIARRDHKQVPEILAPVQSILTQFADDRQQRIQSTRLFFKAQRFPNLTDMEQRVTAQIMKLNFKSQIQLIPPPYFENKSWRVEINFKDIDELSQSLANVLSRTDAINHLIKQDAL